MRQGLVGAATIGTGGTTITILIMIADKSETQCMMKRPMKFVVYSILALALAGCGSTWTAKDVGRGMQLGSMSGNGGWLAPMVWGTGFVIEQVGEAVEGKQPVATQSGPLAEPDESKNALPESQPVD